MKTLYEGSIKIPHGEDEIRAVYGDIRVARVDGKLQIVAPQGWEAMYCVLVYDFPNIGGRKLFVHRLIVEPLRAALTEASIVCPDYKIKTIGCYNVRASRHSDKLSTHSWAIAVDINALDNPMKEPLTTDMPQGFIDAFRRAGFRWGGEFPTPDPMHFQLATGY